MDRGASAPAARGGHAIASIGSKVICFGGADRSPTPFSDLWELNTGVPAERLSHAFRIEDRIMASQYTNKRCYISLVRKYRFLLPVWKCCMLWQLTFSGSALTGQVNPADVDAYWQFTGSNICRQTCKPVDQDSANSKCRKVTQAPSLCYNP